MGSNLSIGADLFTAVYTYSVYIYCWVYIYICIMYRYYISIYVELRRPTSISIHTEYNILSICRLVCVADLCLPEVGLNVRAGGTQHPDGEPGAGERVPLCQMIR